ncbi:GGDEF domain-containing protein [uncultured Maricaulis sp.]|uniref:GGDEF domain-containing protein n=1 Tax=uncultured Maricaulis sp. TaxID=174710 RepID=UPI0030DA1160|tara:strand:+ start:137115 stop:138302 length:1188 start_codon:yes stop_codon:yes gene_type:complete
MLDTKSLATALVLILVIGCTLHIVNWRIHRDSVGVKWWALGLAVHTAGLTLSFWENTLAVHDPLCVVAINMLSLCGSLMLVHGTATFAERPFPLSVYLVIGSFSAIGLGWFATVDDSITMRVVVFAASLQLTYLLTLTRLFYIARRDGMASVFVLGTSLSSTMVMMSGLVVWQLMTQPALGSLYDPTPVIPLAMLGLLASESTAIFGYLLLSAGHSQARLERLAHCDALTDLPNRRAFEQEIAQRLNSARKHDRLIALAIFDIDHFKQVNDKHGHDAGDAVLRHLGTVAAQAVRPRDFLARVGGEEFAVIFEVEDAAELVTAANRLRVAVEIERIKLDETEIAVTVSVGAVLAQSVPGLDFGQLYRAADQALYQAKAAGRNQVVVGEVERLELAA